MPEANFSSVIALVMQQAGWSVARESLSGVGHADIKASHPEHEGSVIVEVKTWGEKNYYEQIHKQVLDYWNSEVVAGAAVMLRATEPREDWPNAYEEKCLDSVAEQHTRLPDRSPLVACFEARSKIDGGRDAVVDHMLLRLPRPTHGAKKGAVTSG